MSVRMHLSTFAWVGAAAVWSCGGKAVIDLPTGAQAGSGGQGATTTTGSAGCDALEQDRLDALGAAQACDPASPANPCTGAAVTRDSCGCEVVANQTVAALVQAANDTYDAWVAAGCGPNLCDGCPPAPPAPWYCDIWTKHCQPAY